MTTLRAALAEAVDSLSALQDNPRLDAEVLLAHVLNQPRYHAYAWPEKTLDTENAVRYRQLVERRAGGEPIAYLTGMREFWSLSLTVTVDTLIPRPETELLVDRALRYLPPEQRLRVADLGTGSGAVAIAIATERPQCTVIATDNSVSALSVAENNIARLGIDNIACRTGDWCTVLPAEDFHLIVSNPPYVASGDPHLAQGDVRFEPRAALAAGPQGMDAIERIAKEAGAHLLPGARLILEHGTEQGAHVRKLLVELGYGAVETYRDLAGHERVTEGQMGGIGC